MKKIIVAVSVILLTITSAAFAQTKDSSATKHRMGRQDKKALMKDLNLSNDQKMKFKEMKKENKDAKSAIESDASLTPDQKKVKIEALKKQKKEKIKTVLTPEQLATYKKAHPGHKKTK